MNILGRLISNMLSGIGSFLARPWILFTAPAQWMLSLSIPARVAVLVAVVLWVGVAAYFVLLLLADPLFVRWQTWLRGPQLAVIIALLIAIPVVVYQALWVWLEGKPSPFPDIDAAFQAGLDALNAQSLDLSRVPLFLIVGSRSAEDEVELLEAGGIDARASCVPQGAAPLHWYITDEGIWLSLTDVGCLSLASSLADELRRQRPQLRPANAEVVQTFRATMMAGSMMLPSEQSPLGGGNRGTLAGLPMAGGGGTMMFDAVESSEPQAPLTLPADKAELQRQRMLHFCRMLRRARYPLAPLNGILTLLPYHLLQAGGWGGEVVAKAARSDVPTLTSELGLRCPLAALVTGMEHQSGFRELIRRVGPEVADANRFGKGADLMAPATTEQMTALASQACGAFEDFVYLFFRKKGASVDPGNKRLFGLLCQVRQGVEERLSEILSGGYSHAAVRGDALLISGLYFGACGEQAETRGFVRKVLEKLHDEQGELAWTEATLARESRFVQWNKTLLTVNFVLCASLIGLAVIYWTNTRG